MKLDTTQFTIFLVDDDPAIRASLQRALQKRGFKVETFESAKSFLDNYDRDNPGCLLLDLSMPEMNGIQLQQELLERLIDLPIIFITGHGDIPQSVQALRAGAIDFLEKPFRPEVLIPRIEEAFKLDAKQREEARHQKVVYRRFERLTEREREVLQLLVAGSANLSSKEIARKLGISHRTVDHHRARIMEKTDAQSVADLVSLSKISGFNTDNF